MPRFFWVTAVLAVGSAIAAGLLTHAGANARFGLAAFAIVCALAAVAIRHAMVLAEIGRLRVTLLQKSVSQPEVDAPQSFSKPVPVMAVGRPMGAADSDLLRDLCRAIDGDELAVVYQPKFDLSTGAAVGVEALVRWPHDERGVLGPEDFLPLAREHGLMAGVTDLVLRRALDDVVAWRAAGAEVPVSVNLSVRTIVDPDLPLYVARELAIRGVSPRMLTVEITEDLLLDSADRARSVSDRLRSSGIRVALDDFGSGYSALWYLRDLAFDEVKLDRGFIASILTSPRAAVIVRAVIELAHQLGGTVVAEGVENAETADRLREYGCDIAQGYFYSEPLPASATLALVTKSETQVPDGVKSN